MITLFTRVSGEPGPGQGGLDNSPTIKEKAEVGRAGV